MRIALCAVVALLGMNSAKAAEYNASLGVGELKCSGWMAQRKTPASAEAASQWVLGYISGLNLHSPTMIIMTEEGKGIVLEMDKLCSANPNVFVMGAATQLVYDTFERRIATMKRSFPKK